MVVSPASPRLSRPDPADGEVSGRGVNCLGPGHSAGDRSLSVTPSLTAPSGFLVHSFAGDDSIACLDHVRERLGLPGFTPQGGAGLRTPAAGAHQALARHDSAAPIKSATVAPDAWLSPAKRQAPARDDCGVWLLPRN
jgi:hypothetical protein